MRRTHSRHAPTALQSLSSSRSCRSSQSRRAVRGSSRRVFSPCGAAPSAYYERERSRKQRRPHLTWVGSPTALRQGLSWYTDRLRADPDGDEAEEFWEESRGPPSSSSGGGGDAPAAGAGSRAGGLREVPGSSAYPAAAARLWDAIQGGMPVSLRALAHAAEQQGHGESSGAGGAAATGRELSPRRESTGGGAKFPDAGAH